ncbi:Serine/threonine protein kinase [Handroanthus impetiginosus]|uniref:Serine/threonine protein kinase n=1 Tax=Handroanthus impetiginosus TaxID=429701 RepID=A0A2G9GFY9_9LAMI|nr:Serine/threonine protein kinase [Handroanthus impetiginosus]
MFKTNILVLLSFLDFAISQNWIRSGYWYSGSDFPVADINSRLFTHLVCAFAHINSSNYEIYIEPSDEPYMSTFTEIVTRENPSAKTLLSILAGETNSSTFFEMLNKSSRRTSFIESSIMAARRNGFMGLDLFDVFPSTPANMANMGSFLDEWRQAINSEQRKYNTSPLILTMGAKYSLVMDSRTYPVNKIKRNFDWVHVLSFDYHNSSKDRFTGAHAALYDPSSNLNTDYGINEWIRLKIGSLWIGFDDVEAIKTKVSYAKEKGLLGYNVFQIPNDDTDWILSTTAQEDVKNQENKQQLRVIVLSTTVATMILVSTTICFLKRKSIISRGKAIWSKRNTYTTQQGFTFAQIAAATNNFSSENKLGEGGFGPVYKGELQNGLQVAAKRLSKGSKQGIEELKNELALTGRLQHVNLVKVLGICTEREEHMLIYEYMPNGSLDKYLFDPVKRLCLDWEKRVQIIEGVTQGLLYLQEYSVVTIIHRDLKASNILLDKEMKPKISDFGIAKVFGKDENAASTRRIIGTCGYIPPEYVKGGIYSRKYDVYSFGVLLLQIISGKKTSSLYGLQKNLNLLEHRCMQVALLCVQERWEDRPSMLEVSSMLKNEMENVPTPNMPAFSTCKRSDGEKICNSMEVHQMKGQEEIWVLRY